MPQKSDRFIAIHQDKRVNNEWHHDWENYSNDCDFDSIMS